MKKLLLIIALSLYSTNYAQTRVASWTSFNTGTATYPLSTNTTGGNVTAGNLKFSNCVLPNDGRTFVRPNSTTLFDAATSPYIEFDLTLNGLVSFDRFVLSGASGPTDHIVSLRWSVDNYATNLGNFTLRPFSDYTLTSVDLDALPSQNAGNVRFRIYFYGGASGLLFAFVEYQNHSSPDNTPLLYVPTFNSHAFQIFANTILANEKFDDNTAFKIFPNPSNGIYTITADANTTVEIFDIVGKSILVQKNNIGQTILNLSQYTAGMYLAKITNQNNQTKTVKLIKQ